jgi:hypothetical protein
MDGGSYRSTKHNEGQRGFQTMKTKTSAINILVDETLAAAIADVAVEKGMARSRFMRHMCLDYLHRHHKNLITSKTAHL